MKVVVFFLNMAERTNNVPNIEDKIKQKQEKSTINKIARIGRFSNIITIPIGIGILIATGNPIPIAADLASDRVYSEVQKRNNTRIENQERGRNRIARTTRVTTAEDYSTPTPIQRNTHKAPDLLLAA